MTYAEAMQRYGSDKPDLRIDLELVEVADLMQSVEFKVFAGPAADPDGRVVIYRRPSRRHAPDTEFDVRGRERLPRVDIVYAYAGADAAAIDAFVAAGAEAIVVAGVPPGLPTPAQRAALEAAAERGVLVVHSSRGGRGRVAQRTVLSEHGIVAADNLNPQRARVLAMLALTVTRDRPEIERIFATY